jgi:hypothetical protein
MRELDRGEAEALALAIQVQADYVLMDESEGRAAARRLGLRAVGVVGVLLRAKRDGALDSVAGALQALVTQAHFHLADQLIRATLAEAGELSSHDETHC